MVLETVQDDNEALVRHLNDGAKRNKLGPSIEEAITLKLAMHFWCNPDDLREVAESEYVDDADSYIERIEEYQEEHLDEVLVAAQHLLGGPTIGTAGNNSLGGYPPQPSEATRTNTYTNEAKWAEGLASEMREMRDDLNDLREQVDSNANDA